MPLNDDQIREVRRAQLKRAAQLRAELMFEQNLERIDHRIDVIEPEKAAILERAEQQNELPVEAS